MLQRDGHLEELAFDFTSTPDRNCGDVFTAEHAEIAGVILQVVSPNLFSAPSACSAVTCHGTCDTPYYGPLGPPEFLTLL